jgi:hypothetical protein
MMTGSGQFGPIEMGGMFTVMKIREGLARDDWFRKVRSGRRSPPMSRLVPSGHSTLSQTIQAIGHSTATRPTTP